MNFDSSDGFNHIKGIFLGLKDLSAEGGTNLDSYSLLEDSESHFIFLNHG